MGRPRVGRRLASVQQAGQPVLGGRGRGCRREDSAEEALDPLDPANLPSFDELLASLPCEEEARLVEEGRMAEAYYNAGLDYREKLNDNKKAIETWAELIEVLDG